MIKIRYFVVKSGKYLRARVLFIYFKFLQINTQKIATAIEIVTVVFSSSWVLDTVEMQIYFMRNQEVWFYSAHTQLAASI